MKEELIAVPIAGDYKQGEFSGYTPKAIAEILGFNANVADDTTKVKYSWGFFYKGCRMGIWDYYGSWKGGVWSFFGPEKYIRELFP